MDGAGRTGADNPMTKQKVREAMFYAIDRATMAKQLMQGGSHAIDTPCYPTQFGCDESAAMKYPYDPAKAKQLLGVQQPVRPIVLYIFLFPFAMASDINDMVRG